MYGNCLESSKHSQSHDCCFMTAVSNIEKAWQEVRCHYLPDAGSAARTNPRTKAPQSVFPFGGDIFVLSGWSQSCLSRRPLAHRCPSRLSLTTLLWWQKLPEFERAYREERRAAFGQAITRLQQMSGAAVATLGKMMVEPTAPPSTRVRAAEVIINQAAKAIELEDIETRVAELERATHALVNRRHEKHLGLRINCGPEFQVRCRLDEQFNRFIPFVPWAYTWMSAGSPTSVTSVIRLLGNPVRSDC